MRIIYSFGNKFAGHGLGTTAYHDVRALCRHDLLQRLLCGSFSPTDIPAAQIRTFGLPDRVLRKLAVYDPSGWVAHVQSILYDLWACRRLEAATVFHVWSRYGLSSLRRARAKGLLTIVECGETHPRHWQQVLVDEHARWGAPLHRLEAALRRQIAEFDAADYVIVNNPAARDTFIAHGIPPEKCVALPGRGVDTRKFVPAADTPRSGFRVLFVGEVYLSKGIPYLLEAFRRTRWHDAELWLVGRVHPEMRPILRRYDDVPGIRTFGHVVDPLAIFQQADCFVLPTLVDASPKVSYEALACGLPVIITPEAGSVVRDGVEGFVVPARDIDALATRLEQLRTDDQLRQTLRIAARRRAEAFSWEAYGEEFVATLKRLRREAPD